MEGEGVCVVLGEKGMEQGEKEKVHVRGGECYVDSFVVKLYSMTKKESDMHAWEYISMGICVAESRKGCDDLTVAGRISQMHSTKQSHNFTFYYSIFSVFFFTIFTIQAVTYLELHDFHLRVCVCVCGMCMCMWYVYVYVVCEVMRTIVPFLCFVFITKFCSMVSFISQLWINKTIFLSARLICACLFCRMPCVHWRVTR